MRWLKRLFVREAVDGASSEPVRVAMPPREGAVGAHGDQLLRKQWAEDVLRAEGVPLNPHLPMIESEAEIALRPAAEAAGRLLALTLVSAKGAGLDPEIVQTVVRERDMRPLFSPAETAFIDDPAPAERDRIQFSWRCEAAWVLLWALRHVDGQLGPPRETCDVDRLNEIVHDDPDLARYGLRLADDLLNEADLIYRCHWAVRQAELDGQPAPAGLDPGVVMERHHALNWLIGYDDADWDDVPTDT